MLLLLLLFNLSRAGLHANAFYGDLHKIPKYSRVCLFCTRCTHTKTLNIFFSSWFVKIKFLLSQSFLVQLKSEKEKNRRRKRVTVNVMLFARHSFLCDSFSSDLNILVKWGFWCQHFFFLSQCVQCLLRLNGYFYGLSLNLFFLLLPSCIWFMRV